MVSTMNCTTSQQMQKGINCAENKQLTVKSSRISSFGPPPDRTAYQEHKHNKHTAQTATKQNSDH